MSSDVVAVKLSHSIYKDPSQRDADDANNAIWARMGLGSDLAAAMQGNGKNNNNKHGRRQ